MLIGVPCRHRLLRRRYNRDMLYPDTHSAQCLFTHVSTLTLLNAIDSNLRKEYVMTGVCHWSLNKLLPLMLSAELTVRIRRCAPVGWSCV